MIKIHHLQLMVTDDVFVVDTEILFLLFILVMINGVLPVPLTLPAVFILPSGISITFPNEVGCFSVFIEFNTVILDKSIVRPVLDTNFAVELGLIVKFSKTESLNLFNFHT